MKKFTDMYAAMVSQIVPSCIMAKQDDIHIQASQVTVRSSQRELATVIKKYATQHRAIALLAGLRTPLVLLRSHHEALRA